MIFIEHYSTTKKKQEPKGKNYSHQASLSKIGINRHWLSKQVNQPHSESESKFHLTLHKEGKFTIIPPLTYSKSTAKHLVFKDRIFHQPSETKFDSKTSTNFSKSYKTFVNLASKSLSTPKPLHQSKDRKSLKSKLELIGHYIKFDNLAEKYRSTSQNDKISDSDCFTNDYISFNKKPNSKALSSPFQALKITDSPNHRNLSSIPKSLLQKKVILSNAILNHSPIEENFLKEIKNKKEKEKHLFSKCDWKGHMKGTSKKRLKQVSLEADNDEEINILNESKQSEKVCFLAETNACNDYRIISGKSLPKNTKFNLNKQDGAYTLDYYESFNNILKTPIHDRICIKKFNKETIDSQSRKNKLKFEDINDLLDMKLIKPKLNKAVKFSLKFKQKDINLNGGNINRQSMLVNKTMIMLPNGKVRIIDNIEKTIEAELSAKVKESA